MGPVLLQAMTEEVKPSLKMAKMRTSIGFFFYLETRKNILRIL